MCVCVYVVCVGRGVMKILADEIVNYEVNDLLDIVRLYNHLSNNVYPTIGNNKKNLIKSAMSLSYMNIY